MRGTTRSDTRGVVTVERVAVWVLAALAIAGLAALAVGPGADLRTATPDVDFEWTSDAQAGSVTVAHDGTERLSAGSTDELVVVVTDVDRNETTRLTWADSRRGLPVEAGDSFTVDDPRVDGDGDGNYLDGDGSVGFYLEAGDTVAVVWTGRILGAPNTRTETLGTTTLGDDEL